MLKKLKRKLLDQRKKIVIDRFSVCLILILVVGIFFRFYNTPERYSLGIDSSRDAMIAIVGAEQIQLPLTGPFSSAGQFTFGPWYYYQIILFTLLTPFAYAPWIYMGIMSVLYIYISYLIGKNLFDKKFGLISALLVSLSPAAIITGTALANPHLV